MKVLFICKQLPYGETNGVEVKIANLLRCMRQIAEVTSVFLVDDTAENRAVVGRLGENDRCILRRRGKTAATRYLLHLNEHIAVGKGMKKRLDAIVAEVVPDLVWLEFGYTCRLIPFLRKYGVPICYGSHNSQWRLDYQIWRAGSVLEKLKMAPFIGLYWLQERFLMGMADRLFCICQSDFDYYSRFVPRSKLGLLPFFFDCRNIRENASRFAHPYVCQVGSLRSRQNYLAALNALDEIWPRVKAGAEELHLYIIGELPARDSPEYRLLMEKKQHLPTVVFTGKVETVIPYVKGALANLVPLTMGSGVRTKIIESAACRTPVISTTVGAAGLPFENGKSILIADAPREFAEKVLSLTRDEVLRRRLSSGAYETYRRELALEAGSAALASIFSELAAARAAAGFPKSMGPDTGRSLWKS